MRKKKITLIVSLFLSIILYAENNTEKINWEDSAYLYNAKLQIEYAKSQISDYSYLIYINDHAKITYNKHHENSIIIFYVVLFIVFLGILFSSLQFYIALSSFKHKKNINNQIIASKNLAEGVDKLNPENETNKDKESVTTFKLSKDGIEFSSSVFGIVILAMSIVFFFLYLKFVYPITESSGNSQKTEQLESKDSTQTDKK